MSATKIWVGSIPSSVKEEELRTAMEKYGGIKQLYYRPISPNRGWAFVTFFTQDQAINAMRQIHGKLTFSDSSRPLEARPPETSQDKQNTSSSTNSSFSSSTFTNQTSYSQNNFVSNNSQSSCSSSSLGSSSSEFAGGLSNESAAATQSSSFTDTRSGRATASDAVSIPPPPAMTCTPVYLWHQYVRPDGHVYFYNTLTGHTQWERPILTKEIFNLLQGNLSNLSSPHTASLSNNLTYYMNYLNSSGSSAVSNPKPTAGRSYGPPGSNLFIFHLPSDWTEVQLKEHFNFFGNIVSCRISTDNVGRNSGFGFVSFDNQASAVSAKNLMNGLGVGGKFLKVQIKKGEEQHLRPDLANLLK